MIDFAQLKKEAQEVDSCLEVKKVNLATTDFAVDPKAVSAPVRIKIGHEWYDMHENARKNIMASLVPGADRIEGEIRKRNKETWTDVVQRLQKISKGNVLVHVDASKNEVLNVSTNRGAVTCSSVVSSVEQFAKTYKHVDLTGQVHIGGCHFGAKLTDTNHIATGGDPNDDTFRKMIYFDYQLGVQPYLGVGLERLVCTNLTYLPIRESWAYFSAGANPHSQINMLLKAVGNANVENLRRITCSFAELLEAKRAAVAVNRTAAEDGRRPPIPEAEITKRFPISQIAARYKVSDEGRGLSNLWLKTALTNVAAYDLYNSITWIASNVQGVTHNEQLRLRYLGGKMLYKEWDIQQVAPTVQW